jgi:hypothetical protein
MQPMHWEITRGALEFAVTFPHKDSSVTYRGTEPIRFFDVNGSDVYEWPTSGTEQKWIVTGEEFLSFEVGHMSGQESGYTDLPWLPASGGPIAYRSAREEAEHVTRVISPLEFFRAGAYDYTDICRNLSEVLKGKKGSAAQQFAKKHLTITRYAQQRGSEILEIAQRDPAGTWGLIARFDGAAGYLGVEHIVEIRGNIHQRREVKYQSQGGAWIPIQFRYEHFALRGEEKPTLDLVRTFRIKESKVNQPVPKSFFAVDHLGLKYGDRFLDKINGRLLVSNGDKAFVPAADFQPDWNRMGEVYDQPHIELSSPPERLGRWILLGNLLLVIVLLCVIWKRRSARLT